MNSHVKASISTVILISIICGIIWSAIKYPIIAIDVIMVLFFGVFLVAAVVAFYSIFYDKYEKSRERNKRNQGGGASGW